MIESDLKKVALNVLREWDKKLSEEEEPKIIASLESVEKDLNNEFEKIVDRFKDKIGDINGEIKDKKDEIIKKAMENLVKSL